METSIRNETGLVATADTGLAWAKICFANTTDCQDDYHLSYSATCTSSIALVVVLPLCSLVVSCTDLLVSAILTLVPIRTRSWTMEPLNPVYSICSLLVYLLAIALWFDSCQSTWIRDLKQFDNGAYGISVVDAPRWSFAFNVHLIATSIEFGWALVHCCYRLRKCRQPVTNDDSSVELLPDDQGFIAL